MHGARECTKGNTISHVFMGKNGLLHREKRATADMSRRAAPPVAGADRQELHQRRIGRRERDRDAQPAALAASSSSRRASAFSTRSNPDPGAHAPTCARPVVAIAARRRSLLSSRNRFCAAMRSAAASSHFTMRSATASRAATSAGDGSTTRGWSAPVRASASSARVHRARPARVRPVAERDHADAVFRQPAHQRAEARQAAAVRHHRRKLAGLRDAQPVAVAAGVQLHAAAARTCARPSRRRAATPAASRAATRAGSARFPHRRAAATRRGTRRRTCRDPTASSACRPSIRTIRSRAAARSSTARLPSDSRARGAPAGTLDGSSVVDVIPSGFST